MTLIELLTRTRCAACYNEFKHGGVSRERQGSTRHDPRVESSGSDRSHLSSVAVSGQNGGTAVGGVREAGHPATTRVTMLNPATRLSDVCDEVVEQGIHGEAERGNRPEQRE